MALTPTEAAAPLAHINIKTQVGRKKTGEECTHLYAFFVCLFCFLLVFAVLKRQGEWQENAKLHIQNDHCLERGMLYLSNIWGSRIKTFSQGCVFFSLSLFFFLSFFSFSSVILKRQTACQENAKLHIQNDNCLECSILYFSNFWGSRFQIFSQTNLRIKKETKKKNNYKQ